MLIGMKNKTRGNGDSPAAGILSCFGVVWHDMDLNHGIPSSLSIKLFITQVATE